jgi:hypothetical protein
MTPRYPLAIFNISVINKIIIMGKSKKPNTPEDSESSLDETVPAPKAWVPSQLFVSGLPYETNED